MGDINRLASQAQEILGRDAVLQDEQSLQFYGRDWIKDFKPAPSLVVLPAAAEQVQAVVRLCKESGTPLVPSGGRTGLSGGATAAHGEVVISLERMRKIFEVNRIDRTLTCEAGVVLERIQAAASESGLYFPVDFSTRGSSQIGGNLATNAGGIRVIKYGNIRDWAVGLVAVTGNGDLVRLNGALFKNNTGYDLRHLLIGSEGTLGIITEATLRLVTPPKDTARVLCGLRSNDDILPLLAFCRDSLRDLSAFEFMERRAMQEVLHHRGLRDPLSKQHPAYILVECELNDQAAPQHLTETFGKAYEEGLIVDVVVSESRAQAQELMNLRDLISETLSSHYTLHKNDISVPVPAIPAFLHELHSAINEAYPGLRVVVFGHVGDGNLHVNVLKTSSIGDAEFWQQCRQADHTIFSLVQKHRGSISAEHGVGLLKREFLPYSRSEEEIEIMRGIKRAFDPAGILNPGKIFQAKHDESPPQKR